MPLLEQQPGLQPQGVVVPEHVTQPGLLDGLGHHDRAQVVGVLGPFALHERARRLHQAALRVDELELAAVARPERGAEAAVLGTDVHRAHPVGVEVVDVAHRAVETVVDARRRGPPRRGGCSVAMASSGSGSSSFVATWS